MQNIGNFWWVVADCWDNSQKAILYTSLSLDPQIKILSRYDIEWCSVFLSFPSDNFLENTQEPLIWHLIPFNPWIKTSSIVTFVSIQCYNIMRKRRKKSDFRDTWGRTDRRTNGYDYYGPIQDELGIQYECTLYCNVWINTAHFARQNLQFKDIE